jgi:spermidine/putrescine transport system permease protein
VSRRRGAPRSALSWPSWFWYAFFFVTPVLAVVVFSFGDKVDGSAGRVSLSSPGFDNYSEALSGNTFDTLVQTFRISILGTLLCLVVGFPLAYFLAVKVPERRRGILLALLMVPFFTNFLIRTIAWKIVLAPRGLIANTMIDWGLRDTGIQMLNTREAVQIGVVYNYLPLMIFPIFVALDRLDPALREASKDLGASRFATFRQVTLPLAAPGVVAGLVLVFVPLSGDYVTASILGGAQGNMAGALVANFFFQAQNPALGAAVAVVLVAAILAVLVIAAIARVVVTSVRRAQRSVELPPINPIPPAATRVTA